jgi:hypothetical protein
MNQLAATLNRNSEPKLVQLLRERIPDDTYTRPGFTLALAPVANARSAVLEISNGYLRTTIVNGSAPDLNISLTSIGTSTLGGLTNAFQNNRFYCVAKDGEMHHDHPSIDLKPIGSGSLLKGGVALNHRRFSDSELRRVLALAAQRQNVNYTVSTVPDTELVFVCTLAAADICRIMAQDAVKRRGLSMDTAALLELAKSYEEQWKNDVKWQRRAIALPKVKDSDVKRGDVIVGTLYRPSFRTGYQTQTATNEEPELPRLHEPMDQEVQDTQVRITWDSIKDSDFYGMELWRDTVDDVQRSQLGNATISPTETQFNQPLPTTASLVFASIGASTRHGRSVLTQYGEASGVSVNTFVDGHDNREDFQLVVADSDAPPPEPETTYYYRLYVFDLNRLAIGSNVVRARTKRLRAILSRDATPIITPNQAPMAGGTAVTVKGERFHAGMRLRLGDKLLENLVVVDTETATATVPAVFNIGILSVNIDLSVESDTGLKDLVKDVFKYTET